VEFHCQSESCADFGAAIEPIEGYCQEGGGFGGLTSACFLLAGKPANWKTENRKQESEFPEDFGLRVFGSGGQTRKPEAASWILKSGSLFCMLFAVELENRKQKTGVRISGGFRTSGLRLWEADK
jgi:hypothetical protein